MLALTRGKGYEICLSDIPEPYILKEDDVKIRVLYSSFCRDDMRYLDKLDVFSKIGLLGHEVVGIIEDLGPYAKWSGFSIKDIVVVLPWDFCGKCEQCLSQRVQYCAEAHVVMGTMTKYIVRKSRQLIKIPHDMSYRQAVLMEPVGDILEGISKLPIDYNKEILVIGAGFIGLVFVKLLRMRGVKSITVIEPIVSRRKRAMLYGADYALDPYGKDFHMEVLETREFDGYDIVIETSSNVQMLESSVSFLAKGGVLEIFTYYGSMETISFPSLDMYASNITVLWSSLCSINSMKTAAYLIQKESLDELITMEYDFSHVLQAFEKFKTHDQIKIGVKNF